MRTLTPHEKRTLRMATAGLAIYLGVFAGWQGWRYGEQRRSEYQKLVKETEAFKLHVQPYEPKALVVTKLMESFRLDPARLSRTSLVAEASAAIQKAALTGGIQLGPVRETPARPSAKELASIQLEGTGPVPAVMALLHRVERLGYPLIADSIQLTPETTKPGQVKLKITIVILDFEQWKSEEKPHA